MKKLIKILPVVMVICVVLTSVFATGVSIPNDKNPLVPADKTESIGTLDTATYKVWNTVATVVRILAIAAVLFAGLRYMFSSADQKADIKKSMGILAIGAILVFGATFILDLLMTITEEVAS